jgi:hypothetical protein
VNDLSIRPDESVAAFEQRRAAAAAAPANGQAVEPLPPAGRPAQWIVLGPRTRQQLARVLEQAPLSVAVLVALLEQSGAAPEEGWNLVLGEAHLEPAGTPPKG